MVVQGLGLHTVIAGVLSLVGEVPHIMQCGQKTGKSQQINNKDSDYSIDDREQSIERKYGEMNLETELIISGHRLYWEAAFKGETEIQLTNLCL